MMYTALNVQFNISPNMEEIMVSAMIYCNDFFLFHDTVIFLSWLSACGAQQSFNILSCNKFQRWTGIQSLHKLAAI